MTKAFEVNFHTKVPRFDALGEIDGEIGMKLSGRDLAATVADYGARVDSVRMALLEAVAVDSGNLDKSSFYAKQNLPWGTLNKADADLLGAAVAEDYGKHLQQHVVNLQHAILRGQEEIEDPQALLERQKGIMGCADLMCDGIKEIRQSIIEQVGNQPANVAMQFDHAFRMQEIQARTVRAMVENAKQVRSHKTR